MTRPSRHRIGNLPLELTSFVGRRREAVAAQRLLSATRLVTMTGTGGVGKTRLALRVATEVTRAFDDGVWMVDLSELTDGSSLVIAVSDVLGLTGQADADPEDRLVEYLATRAVLLVLDCCEQRVVAAAALCTLILRRCPGVRILATSRQVLGLAGEAVFQVPSLVVPGEHPSTLQGTSRYEAVRLPPWSGHP
jgi:predicted ATPase